MPELRTVTSLLSRRPAVEGAGVRLNRVFGAPDPALDPFLLLDEMGSDDPADYVAGFPWHPHRGIETVTYLLSGVVEHADSLGNRGVIRSGDVQWMSAGSGIIHQEMPQRYEGSWLGYQLWVNLPAAEKMSAPRYREIPAATIPEVAPAPGVRVKVVAGETAGARGPVRDVVADPLFLDLELSPGVRYEHPVAAGHTALVYVVSGAGELGGEQPTAVIEGQLAVLSDGDAVVFTAGARGMRALLFAARPLREPVAWYGPIVMNTQAELAQAFDELQAGTFAKHKS